MLIGKEGILVNEIACRLGGAYEDITIPLITGVDPLELLIKGSIDRNYNYDALDSYRYGDNNICASTQLFFCKSGFVDKITPADEMLRNDFIVDLGYNYKVGDFIKERVNASQRAGYLIIKGKSEKELSKNIDLAFKQFVIEDQAGNNLIIKGKRGNRE